MSENEALVTVMLAREFADASMRTLVKITPELKLCLDRLEEVCAVMRQEAKAKVDKMMEDTRKSPWMAQGIIALAALEVAQAGKRKALEIINEKENRNEN